MKQILQFFRLCLNRLAVFSLLALSAVFLAEPVAFGITFMPVDPQGHGKMTFYPYHEDTFWANDAVFTSFYGLKVLTDDGKFNFIVPINENLDCLTGFSDMDYKNTVYGVLEYFDNDTVYTFTYTGDPAGRPPYVTTYEDHSPYDILSYDYTGVPAGKYHVECTLTDGGTVLQYDSGSIKDDDAILPYEIYIVDFEEQERVITSAAGNPVCISLKTIPSALPNKDSLKIAVSWNGSDSCLYTDSACTDMITGNYLFNERRWAFDSAPKQIFFRRGANDATERGITIKLIAFDSITEQQILSRTLCFKLPGSLMMAQVRGGKKTGVDMEGFWDKPRSGDKEFVNYSGAEWSDDIFPYDGVAVDAPDLYYDDEINRDSNKPFLYDLTSAFTIHGGSIRHNDNQTYTNDDYKVVTESSFDLIDDCEGSILSDSNGIITFGAIAGGRFTEITARNVVISWKLVNRHTGDEINVGETQHFVYAAGKTIDGGEIPLHTIVDIGCRAAAGRSAGNAAFEPIWDHFASLEIYRIDGAGPITYWGPLASVNVVFDPNDPSTDLPWYFTSHGLIKKLDGRCGGWSQLFIDVCDMQGIDSVAGVALNAIQPGDPNYRYTLYQNGPLQGNSVLNYSPFADHVIDFYNGRYYDVTMGRTAESLVSYLINNIEIEKHELNNGLLNPAITGNRIALTLYNYNNYVE